MQQVGFFENSGVRLPEFEEPALDQFATTDAFGEVARERADVRSRTHYMLPFPDAPPAAPARSVAEEVRDLREDRAVRLAVPLREVTQGIQPILLLVVAVVAQVEHRPGVDAVGQQQVPVKRPVERVVHHDVPEQQPLRELERGKRPEHLDVEHQRRGARIFETAQLDVQL